jgi:hypothetical protein
MSTRTSVIEPSEMDDLIVHAVIFVIGLIPVATAAAHGGTWGAQPSLGLLMMLFATGASLARYRERARARRKPAGQSEHEES